MYERDMGNNRAKINSKVLLSLYSIWAFQSASIYTQIIWTAFASFQKKLPGPILPDFFFFFLLLPFSTLSVYSKLQHRLIESVILNQNYYSSLDMFRSIIQSTCQNSKRFYSTPAYTVMRTTNKGLPVYSEYKNGGTRLLTIIRRIQGDSNALVKDLVADFPAAEVNINPKTQHVIIKGHHVNELKEWLILKGF